MSRIRMLAVLCGTALVWGTAAGCVALDEHKRVEFARRQALAQCDELRRDLDDERARSMAMERERDSLDRELNTTSAMAKTLEGENERLDGIRKTLQEQLDAMLAKGVGDIQIVEVKLPPELDRALQDFATQYPETIEYDAERGAVRWKSDLTFALGSDNVRQSVRDSLQAFANIVNSPAADPFEVVVVGHTDDVRIGAATAKKHATNWHLSVHRAVAVVRALSEYGVAFQRLGAMGYGEHRPRQPNPPRGGCEANRRVEIFLVAAGDQSAGMETATRTLSAGTGVAKTPSQE